MNGTRETAARQVWRGTKPSPFPAAPITAPGKTLRMTSPWRIELLGGLSFVREDQVISRFQTRKTAALLGYLAYQCDKTLSREMLAELLWPDTDLDAARNSLRVALTSLRRQLEPPGVPAGAVLFSDRTSVRLNASACVTDIADFENALKRERNAFDADEKLEALLSATALYKGVLLPGWYEEWVQGEQARLAELYAGALYRLTLCLFQRGDNERALDCARLTVQADPLREEAHRHIMRLHALLGNPSAAREQFQKLETVFQKELGITPSETTRALLLQIENGDFAGADLRQENSLTYSLLAPTYDIPPRSHFATASLTASPALPGEKPSPRDGSSIPLQFTRFFGREEEVARLSAILHPQNQESSKPRLVTITGPGGIGKTRLSIVVAAHLRETAPLFARRIWVISLADLTEVTQIAPTILSTVNRPIDPQTTPLAQILDVLSESPALLVFDNMEQFAEGGAHFVRSLLERLPELRLLVTSRHRLGLEGEQEFPLSPLPSPADDPQIGLEKIAAWPSVALFVDRVQAVRPDFQITPRNAGAIATLCRRLDGLPLALELAAAWARLLTPAQMVERLSERFDLLISERRDVSLRHRSLRAVMDESWRLLPEALGRFLEQLTVFRGGWTLAAAEAICADKDHDILDNLGLLQDHSLIFLDETEAGIRFRMLESVREYAHDMSGLDDRTRFLVAHTDYYTKYAQSLAPQLSGSLSESAQSAVENDYENFRAALLYSVEANLPKTNLRLATSLWRFWYRKGYVEEGSRFLEAVCEMPVLESPETLTLLVTARNGAGRLAMSRGDMRAAAAHFCKSLALLESREDTAEPNLTAMSLVNWGIAARACGDFDAASIAYTRLTALYQAQNDPWASACASSILGGVLRALHHEARARTAFAASLRVRQLWGDRWGAGADESSPLGLAGSYLNLGHIAAEQGDHGTARGLFGEALAAYRGLQDELGCALVWERIAVVAAHEQDWTAARKAAEECLLLRQENRSAPPVIDFTRHLQQATLREEWPFILPTTISNEKK